MHRQVSTKPVKSATQAVLGTLKTHFGDRPLQFWDRPLSQIDMEKAPDQYRALGGCLGA